MRPVSTSEKYLNCWISGRINQIYTKDMASVGGAIYYRMPLNYVSAFTGRRLQVKYSLLITQLSQSSKAFWYWDELAKNMGGQAELFSSQPALTPSNICNIENKEEVVIGYFSIAGASRKRIMVSQVPGLDVYRDPYYCAPLGPPPINLWRYPRDKLPLYLAVADIMGVRENGVVEDDCVDCRQLKGSTDQKPDYW
jgi:hypothetical protein